MKLDHIQLAVPQNSETECRAFWIDLLGFREIEKPAALRPRGGLWLISGSTEVHLGVEANFRPAKKAHPAFRVSDLDGLAGSLELAGHPVRWDDKIKGRRRFFTDDPVGNRVELIEDA